VSFDNKHTASCPVKPLLTIPRAYIRDFNDLKRREGARELLVEMLTQGFQEYGARGHEGPTQMCIHYPNVVSVHWLHLHSFCVGVKFDGMPGGPSMCEVMGDVGQAGQIASKWMP